MNKAKITTVADLTEFISVENIEGFDGNIDKGNFPLVICYNDEKQYLGFVSLDDFEYPDFVSKTERILEWHEGFVNDGLPAEQFQILLQSRTQLSKLLKPLGDYVAYWENERKKAEHRQQMAKDAAFLISIKQGSMTTIANAEARQATSTYGDEVLQLLNAQKRADALLSAVNQTLNAMAGNIKQVQSEMNKANYAN
jgi:hypothetical protein